MFMGNPRIFAIEWAPLIAQRPREARCNARLGVHGQEVKVPIARFRADDGCEGFGYCRITEKEAKNLLGIPVNELIDPANGVFKEIQPFEFVLWDLICKQKRMPVYQVIAERLYNKITPQQLQVPCYDTSLYIDDLHLDSDEEAADLIAEEARYGYEQNHRAFKIKVGRGAHHMPIMEGTRRDIAVIKAVREAVGPEAKLMIDANNGYNLNLTKMVLAETAECNLHWIEEAFHEDPVLYEELRNWMVQEGLSVLIADGEGDSSPRLLTYARQGLIDVVQYDIFDMGLAGWVPIGLQLDKWGRWSAPHHYGRYLGNFVTGHMGSGVMNLAYIEWDEAVTPVIDTSSYVLEDGIVTIPNKPGFGLELDEDRFLAAVDADGFRLKS